MIDQLAIYLSKYSIGGYSRHYPVVSSFGQPDSACADSIAG